MEEEFLTPDDLIDRYRDRHGKPTISKRTLANWRSIKDGPTPTKIGGRVLYKLSNVLKWEERRTRAS